ncbi:hemolysin XhlA family protein [Priestia megaterium]|uniref:hemolysin XhlA family protein n=1 Tax=Priestia megaterium TaxID=1404 RepID=UPI00366C9EC8
MSEPTSRELSEKIADIREWLVRIDTKVDYLNEVRRTAEEADRKADEGLALAKENKEDIAEMKANQQFRFNLTIGAILTIIGFLVTIGIALFS